MTTKMLRPGLLVSLSSRVTGGVRYDRRDLDAGDAMKAIVSDNAEITRWETTKVIDDPAEFERATKIRGQARSLIAGVCAHSDFGLLCPSSREFDLNRAVEEAKRIAAEHNASATKSFVSVYVITGRIAQDDAEAARAVASEVRGLMDEMKAGIDAADPERIRKAANAAKSLGAMLTDDANLKVTTAITEARRMAREIVKRVEKSGEESAKVIAECDRKALDEARASFLDFEDVKPVESTPVAAASVDMEPASSGANPSGLEVAKREAQATAPSATPIDF